MDACVDWSETGGSLEAGRLHSLASLHKGARGTVSAVRWSGAAGLTVGDAGGASITRRLLELGFAPGEPFEIIEEIRPGGDPIAVRIGSSVFALRRREAEAVVVRLE